MPRLVSSTQKSLLQIPVTQARDYYNFQKYVFLITQIILAPNAPNFQEMRLVFPNAHRINRGGYVVKELAVACRANDVTDLIILHEHRGVPGSSSLIRSISCVSTQPDFVRRNDYIALPSWAHSILHSTLRQSPP